MWAKPESHPGPEPPGHLCPQVRPGPVVMERLHLAPLTARTVGTVAEAWGWPYPKDTGQTHAALSPRCGDIKSVYETG